MSNLWLVVMAWLISTTGGALEAAAADTPAAILLPGYTRKATWQETMCATRSAMAAREEALRKAGGENSPWPGTRVGEWSAIGPFPAAGPPGTHPVDQPGLPESEPVVDLNRKYGKLQWSPQPKLQGLEKIALAEPPPPRITPPPGPCYLHTVIYAADEMVVPAILSRGGPLAVRLNGRLIYHFKRGDYQGHCVGVRLHLKRGENHLLVKLPGGRGSLSIRPFESWPRVVKYPAPENPLTPVWAQLQQDFPDLVSQRTMRWEREAGIWNGPWEDVQRELPQRYAALVGRGAGLPPLPAEADLPTLRGRFYRAMRLREVQRFLTPPAPGRLAPVESLRLAINDLIATYGERYPRGQQYLERLEQLLAELQSLMAKLPAGDATVGAAYDAAADALFALQREALLANPLLDFDRLLVVRRFTAYHGLSQDNGLEPGYATSWGSVASLPAYGWNNHIAVAAVDRQAPRPARCQVVYQPTDLAYVGCIDLHWDAKRLLFTSSDARGCQQIFELTLDSGRVRQITRDDDPDIDNFEGCYLPDGGIVFNSTAPLQGVPCSANDAVANLYRCEADGSRKRRLCFDQDQNFSPTLMNDGRIMYTRWEYADTNHTNARILMAMRPDGSQQIALYGSNSYWPAAIWHARPIPNDPSKFVAIVAGHHGSKRRGDMVLFDMARGVHEERGAVQMLGRRGRPVPRVVTEAFSHGWPAFLHPWPLSDKYFLAAVRATPTSQWTVCLVDVFDNLVPLVEDPLYGVLEAIPLRPRVRPPIIPSLVEPRQREASILVADVYRGPGLRGVPRGTVKGLRIYGFEYAYQGMSGWAAHGNNGGIDRRILLGTARVEADGSAHFLLPANLPVAVQPIDGQGRAIQTMRSWYTAMPGERGACVGCHEPMSDTAPLRAVRAGLRPPEAIAPWHGPARRFDFNREVVRPVLSRHCASCHDLPGLPRKKGKEPPPPRLEQAFLLKYTRHIGQESDLKLYPPGEWYADAAELIQMLRKGHQGVLLSEEDFARLTTWLDLNAPGSGTWPQPTNAQMERRRVLQAVYEGHGDAALFEAGPLPPFAEPLPPNPDRDAPETPIKLPGWPFDAGEARRKQRASGAEVSLHIPVGANSEGKPIVLEMVRIPAGRFVMGEAAGPRDEKPATVVEITKPFWMATTEVTNELYQLFDPEHDSYRYDGRPTFPQQEEHIGPLLSAPRQPVVRVNWERARAFCKWLSAKTGRRFDLPTEAQWEWACRAGGDGPFWYGDHTADFASFANLADLSFAPKSGRGGLPGPARIYDQRFNDGALVSAPVGQYAANPWGLHDMHGNVAEWTRSAYRPYPYADNDGRNNDDLHEDKVIRGGSWHDRPRRATAAFRNYRPAWMGAFDVGFRVICEGD